MGVKYYYLRLKSLLHTMQKHPLWGCFKASSGNQLPLVAHPFASLFEEAGCGLLAAEAKG